MRDAGRMILNGASAGLALASAIGLLATPESMAPITFALLALYALMQSQGIPRP